MPLRILFILFIFTLANDLSGQGAIQLSGRVLSHPSAKPVEFASVLLRSRSDSTLQFITATDSTGKFMFENVAPGRWLLKYTFLGYEPQDTALAISPEPKKVNLGDLMLSSALNLDEVTVSAEKNKLLEFSIDKKIYNVGQDLQSAAGSAGDVLKNVPSVQLDIDGNVSLRGSGNVLILINGRPSALMKKTQAEALENLPAATIERIEVITNPSAKYRPDGTAGIINIVLKKNTRSGLQGSVALNAGNNDRYNGNLALSYKPGKLNLYGNVGLRQNTHRRYSFIDRENFDSIPVVKSIYREDNSARGKSFSQSAVLGMDYDFDDRNTVSLTANYFHFDVDRHNTSDRRLFQENTALISNYKRLSGLSSGESELEATFAFQHKFKKEDHELQLEATAVKQDEREDLRNAEVYSFPAPAGSFDNIFLDKREEPGEIDLEYANPLAEDAMLEAGYSGIFNRIDLISNGEYFQEGTASFVPDPSTSYVFQYRDAIHALYATWEQEIEDFGFLLGLRAERVDLRGDVVSIDSVFKNDYRNLYPSLHLSYELGEGALRLSYSKRVNRPDGDELNPFPEYDDPRNLYAGNPRLLPEYIHSVELGCEMQRQSFSFVPTLYYRYTYNGFTSVTVPLNDSTLLTTEQNLSSSQAAGLELIFSGRVLPWLSGNLSTDIFYNRIDASNLGYSADKSTLTAGANLNANIAVSKRTMIQLNSNYRSRRLTPQGEYAPVFGMNFGAKQEFLHNKLAVTLTVNDVFHSYRNRGELRSAELHQVSESWRDSRIVFLGLKYRFGTTIKDEGVLLEGGD